MLEPVRHRQTKGAATDMLSLPPPRHTPTLPNGEGPAPPQSLSVKLQRRKSLRAGGYYRSVATNDLPFVDHSSSSNVLVGPMTRLEAAADDRRGRAFAR